MHITPYTTSQHIITNNMGCQGIFGKFFKFLFLSLFNIYKHLFSNLQKLLYKTPTFNV